jgi:beta-glucanase (GH16 family)
MESYQTLVNPADLTFDDEFNTFISSPDGSVGWMTSYPYGGEAARSETGTHDAQYFSDSSVGTNPFTDVNGVLDIAATVAVPGSNPYGLPYTSGMITTYRSMAQTYGYFELRAELPAGQGMWPAFWLLPTASPYTSELDVFEVLGEEPGYLYATAHNEVNGVWSDTTTRVTVPNTSTGFHTYGVDWEPTTITFYMDGQVIWSTPTPSTMNSPMYMLVTNGVGGAGSWPGAPSSNSEFPAVMQVDYVRAYATANTIEVSGTAAIKTAAVTGQVLIAGTGWSGATVTLLNAAGTAIATTKTNSAGSFSFTGLAAGTYQIRYTAPTGIALQTGSQANTTTGLTGQFTVDTGQTVTLAAEQLGAPADPATITSDVLYFANPAASVGTGESGVAVTLLSGSGAVVGTTVTAAGGKFSFAELAAGTYQLQYATPAGQTIEPGSAANPTTGLTALFTVAAGQSFTAPGGSMVPLGSIGGAVMLSGAPEAGVAVSLLDASGGVVATSRTGASGTFAFNLLAAGTYQVKYAAPSGLVFQTGSAANAATGLTPTLALATSQALTVPTELLLSNPATVESTVLHFGASTDEPWGTGMGGVTVELLNAAGTVIATALSYSWGGFSFGQLAAGTYQVKYLAPTGEGIHLGSPENQVTGLTAQFAVAAGQTVTAPYGGIVSNTIGGVVALAGHDEAGVGVSLLGTTGAVVASTVTNSAGAFTFAGMAAGTYQVKYAAPSGQVFQTGSAANAATGLTPAIAVAAGAQIALPTESLLSQPATIQSSVLHFGSPTDASWGTGVGGVTVSLLNAAGTVIATTVSASWGGFSFGQIGAGTYQLQYAAPAGEGIRAGAPENQVAGVTAQFTVAAGQTVTAPTGELVTNSIGGTVQLAGAAEAGVAISLLSATRTLVASTATNSAGAFSFSGMAAGTYQVKYTAPAGQVFETGSEANATTGLTPAIVVDAGAPLALPAEQLLSDPATIDAVVEHFGAPTDPWWGTGEGGVTVALLNAAGTAIATTVSNASGEFSFGQIGAGTYELKYLPPVGQGINAGSPENQLTGVTAPFAVAAGKTVAAPNGALVTNGIAGTVQLSGVPEAGVAVSLLTTAGAVVAATTTGSTGTFAFTGMAAGSYQVKYTAPSGQVFETGSEASAATGLTPGIVLTEGAALNLPVEQLLSRPATIESMVAHFGAPTDAASGTGEAGVTVSLLNVAGTVIATTVSGAGGAFSFGQIGAGTYQLRYTPPSGQGIDAGAPENQATELTAPFAVAAGQVVAAPAGALVTNSIGGTVQLAGGAEAGVTVSLLNGSGTVIASTATNSAGAFAFTGMTVGDYQVKYVAPAGQVLQTGSEASFTTGLTPSIALAAGETLILPAEQMLSSPATIQSNVVHFGAPTDPSWGKGEGGVTVSLLNAAGAVIATTVTASWGGFSFGQIGAGTYQLRYTLPAGQVIDPASPENQVTGLTAQFTVAVGQTVSAPYGGLITAITMNGSGLTEVAPAGAYLVAGNASHSALTLGNGNQYVTLTGTADTVVTGAGNQTVTLSGTGNTITVGTGTSTIDAGSGGDTVHAAGGDVTITAAGAGNLFDGGLGLGFLNADGSANNIFMLNAAGVGQELVTITGFNPAADDILDLKRTLAGTNILSDLSNVGNYVIADATGANTTLYFDSTGTGGHGSPQAFAVLDGVHVTVAQLQTAHEFSLS